jgi:hypothetical protein
MTANLANDDERQEDHIVAAAKHGFALVNRNTGAISYIARPWEEPDKLHK